MNLTEAEKWIAEFYSERTWTKYGPFERLGFILEEAGEIARVVRSMEIGRDRPDETAKTVEELHRELIEELGDMFANITILAQRYGISLNEIVEAHQQKLTRRFAG